MGEQEPDFGILHVDAHSDTRDAYEGFVWSHASIMRNVLTQVPSVKRMVQVGIRDFCQQEYDFCREQGARLRVFYDDEIATAKLGGEHWHSICGRVIDSLPERVWISFDIDGLDPSLCPHTGTPVPGGLSFHEACFLLRTLARSGRRVLGFDVNEVAPGPPGDEWDANVGARLLYKLACWTFASQGLVESRS
jgi:agmatinase